MMKRAEMRKVPLRGITTVVVLALAPAAAFAYIDVGNGAYMVQALFTVAGAALFYLRHPIRTAKKIGLRISRAFRPGRDAGDSSPSIISSELSDVASAALRTENSPEI